MCARLYATVANASRRVTFFAQSALLRQGWTSQAGASPLLQSDSFSA